MPEKPTFIDITTEDIQFSDDDLGHGEFRRLDDRFKWVLTKGGNLYISGRGTLTNVESISFSINKGEGWDGHFDTETCYAAHPWEQMKDRILTVTLGPEIHRIETEFCGYTNLHTATILAPIRELTGYIFANTALRTLNLHDDQVFVSANAIKNTPLLESLRNTDSNGIQEAYYNRILIEVVFTNDVPLLYQVRPGTVGIDWQAFSQSVLDIAIPSTVRKVYNEYAKTHVKRFAFADGIYPFYKSYYCGHYSYPRKQGFPIALYSGDRPTDQSRIWEFSQSEDLHRLWTSIGDSKVLSTQLRELEDAAIQEISKISVEEDLTNLNSICKVSRQRYKDGHFWHDKGPLIIVFSEKATQMPYVAALLLFMEIKHNDDKWDSLPGLVYSENTQYRISDPLVNRFITGCWPHLSLEKHPENLVSASESQPIQQESKPEENTFEETKKKKNAGFFARLFGRK